MTIVVPFDGRSLSVEALKRGRELGNALDMKLVAVTIVPNSNARYARQRGWLEEGETFDAELILNRLAEQVYAIVPEAGFEYEVVGRFAQPGEIASNIRRLATQNDAAIVVLGSDNAGHIVTSVSSVASTVAADDSYDVMIVRHGVESAQDE